MEFTAAITGAAFGIACCVLSAYRRGEPLKGLPVRRLSESLWNGSALFTIVDLLYAVTYDPTHLVHLTSDNGSTLDNMHIGLGTVHRIEIAIGCILFAFQFSCNLYDSCKDN